jgi:hypothetical protein
LGSAGPRFGEQGEEKTHDALLVSHVLGGGRHPPARPLPLLRLEAERGRQRLEAEEQIVGGQAGRAQPRDHRAAHRGVPDPRERLEQRRVARRVRLLSEMLDDRGEQWMDAGIALFVDPGEAGEQGFGQVSIRSAALPARRSGRRQSCEPIEQRRVGSHEDSQ